MTPSAVKVIWLQIATGLAGTTDTPATAGCGLITVTILVFWSEPKAFCTDSVTVLGPAPLNVTPLTEAVFADGGLPSWKLQVREVTFPWEVSLNVTGSPA